MTGKPLSEAADFLEMFGSGVDMFFGDSVARTIKQYNGTKIILISAYDLDSAFVKDLEENKYIVKFIEKPIQVADLIEIVASTIS